jgi:ferredoxin
MEKMLMALDKTPNDAEQLEVDLLRTSGKAPATIAAEMEKRFPAKKKDVGFVGKFFMLLKAALKGLLQMVMRCAAFLHTPQSKEIEPPKAIQTPQAVTKEVTEQDLKAAFANENMKLAEDHAVPASPALSSHVPASPALSSHESMAPSLDTTKETKKLPPLVPAVAAKTSVADAEVPEVDDPSLEPALAAEEKGPPKMIPGHELLGEVPVVFQPANKMTMARVGQPLSEVASAADVFIRYKCRKGECKTCVVNIDNRWVSACQTKIPPVSKGQYFEVRVRLVSDAAKKEGEKAAFFSAKIAGFVIRSFRSLSFLNRAPRVSKLR